MIRTQQRFSSFGQLTTGNNCAVQMNTWVVCTCPRMNICTSAHDGRRQQNNVMSPGRSRSRVMTVSFLGSLTRLTILIMFFPLCPKTLMATPRLQFSFMRTTHPLTARRHKALGAHCRHWLQNTEWQAQGTGELFHHQSRTSDGTEYA